MPPSEAGDENVATYQAALLELLVQDLPVDAILERLNKDPAFGAFGSYIRSWDPRMLEVAAALVKKWGKRAVSGPSVRSDIPE